jgi:hypothetical protein
MAVVAKNDTDRVSQKHGGGIIDWGIGRQDSG